MNNYQITTTINGKEYTEEVEPRLLLSDFIRHTIGLTGTHVGCEHGVCGACTILFNGDPVRSCIMLAVQANGHVLETVESLGTPDNMHPLQTAFHEEHGLQCGYCTPGFLMTLKPWLEEVKATGVTPTDHDIRTALSGNLCRCTGYQHIVNAVKRAVNT